MAVNRHREHIYVLPEDDANRQIANGVALELATKQRQFDIREVAGGWLEVLRVFNSDYAEQMRGVEHRYMILLIDFDDRDDRLTMAKGAIPADLIDRVMVIGAWSTPEDLRAALGGTYEEIGQSLARECRQQTDTIWSHPLLQHNSSELARLDGHLRPILF